MRVSDDRYSRDRLRLDVALRFIRYEARTHTIRAWTGLTDDRIRKLYRSYLTAAQSVPLRHRGKSPQQPGFFIRTARARLESALFASLCRLSGALPLAAENMAAGTAPSLTRATLLCQAYEAYRALIHPPLISFEHAVFLFDALGRGQDLALAHCSDCGALVVVDRWSLRAARCMPCEDRPAPLGAAAVLPTDLTT